MHAGKIKLSLFPGVRQPNESSLYLDVTEAPHSETESPFLHHSSILAYGCRVGKSNRLLNMMRNRI